MSQSTLPPDYHRSLSVVAREIEDSLNDILVRLQGNSSSSLLHRIEPSFSDDERAAIAGAVGKIRAHLVSLIETFNLSPSSVTELQILQAHYAHMWTLLQDSYSSKMKGYGEISEDQAITLDTQIAQLAEKVEKLKGVIVFTQNRDHQR